MSRNRSILLAGYTLFIAYNTLFPFQFDRNWRGLIPFLARISEPVAETSMTDIVGNILLFVPFGLLAGLFAKRQLLAFALSGFGGMVISSLIEAAQSCTSIRNAAFHDILNNTIGSVVGCLSAIMLTGLLMQHGAAVRRLLQTRPLLMLVLSVLALHAAASAMPLRVTITVSSLKDSVKQAVAMPFTRESVSEVFLDLPPIPLSADTPPLAISMAEDVLFWSAFGALFAAYWRSAGHSERRRLLAGMLMFLPLVEVGQLAIVDRTADINDILASYIGLALGASLFRLLGAKPCGLEAAWHREFGVRDASGRHDTGELVDEIQSLRPSVVLFGIYVLFQGLAPFDWTTSAISQFQTSAMMPFAAYFQNTTLDNITDLAKTVALGVPISAYIALSAQRRGLLRRTARIATLLEACVMGMLIEASQLFSASRTADITDVIAFVIGAYLPHCCDWKSLADIASSRGERGNGNLHNPRSEALRGPQLSV